MPEERKGRAADQAFADDELLYRRFREGDIVAGFIFPASFKFPPSFNRSKYSVPEDVIHEHCADGRNVSHWGIYSVAVRDARCSASSGLITFRFWPNHDPQEK